MSSLDRLMSMVFEGVLVALLGPLVEHETATSAAAISSATTRRIDSRIRGALVGGSAHFRWRVLSAPVRGRGAEPLVIDVIGDRWMLAADRALRIAAQTDLAEAALERVVQEVPADERLADPEKQLDRLRCLQRADDARQDAEYSGFGARRRELGRRWLREKAAVARTLEWLEDRDLPLEAEDRSMHDGNAMFHRSVIQEIARGEVVGAVDHHVVALDDAIDIRSGQTFLVADDLHVGVQSLERLLRRGDLRLADAVGGVKDLPLQVGEVDHIRVDDAEHADAGGCEVIRRR